MWRQPAHDGSHDIGFDSAFNSNWLRIAAYMAAATICIAVGVIERRRGAAGTRWFWFAVAAVLLALGMGRQLSLGPWITGYGRDLAYTEGWYDDRRAVQKDAIEAMIAVGALALFVGGSLALMRSGLRYSLAFCGVVALVCFVAIRTISYHDIDSLLYRHPIQGVRLASGVELLGALYMCLIAAVSLALATKSGDGRVCR